MFFFVLFFLREEVVATFSITIEFLQYPNFLFLPIVVAVMQDYSYWLRILEE